MLTRSENLWIRLFSNLCLEIVKKKYRKNKAVLFRDPGCYLAANVLTKRMEIVCEIIGIQNSYKVVALLRIVQTF